MIKNYFYLNRLVIEIKDELIGKTIHEAFTQEKNSLYLNISDSIEENLHLFFNVEQNYPTFYLKEHHKAKKNIINFFEDILPVIITNVEISSNDRIIKFSTDKGDFYFLIRGNKTNFLFLSENYFESFRKIEKEETKVLFKELTEQSFISGSNKFILNFIKCNDIKEAYQTIPFINNKKIKNELEYRGETTGNLLDIISDIYNGDISIYIDELYKVILLPSSFNFDNSFIHRKSYNYFRDASKEFIILSSKYAEFCEYKKNKIKEINSKLEKLSYKLNKLKKRLDEGSKEKEYKNIADLLLTNIYLLKKGLTELEVFDHTINNNRIVKLDEKLSPNQNIDKYYEKSRDEKINYKKSEELYKDYKKEYQNLLNLKVEIENLDINVFSGYKKLNKPKKIKNKMLDEIKYREYLIENKYHFYIGKDSKSNDLLTVKFAKQNDYWFHARGYAGSHGVLRIDNKKEVPPRSVIKKAASIAAFHSKAKTAKLAPVIYTFAKFVYKKKGSPAGQVSVTKEKVILVKPEIPNDCEYVEKEN